MVHRGNGLQRANVNETVNTIYVGETFILGDTDRSRRKLVLLGQFTFCCDPRIRRTHINLMPRITTEISMSPSLRSSGMHSHALMSYNLRVIIYQYLVRHKLDAT